MFAVAVPEHRHLGACEASTVHDRRMVELVREDDSARVPERCEHAEIGRESRREERGALLSLPRSELGFELVVHRTRSGYEPGGTRSRAPPLESYVRCLDDRRMGREAQVVVGCECDDALARPVRACLTSRIRTRCRTTSDGATSLAPRARGIRVRRGRSTTSRYRPSLHHLVEGAREGRDHLLDLGGGRRERWHQDDDVAEGP